MQILIGFLMETDGPLQKEFRSKVSWTMDVCEATRVSIGFDEVPLQELSQVETKLWAFLTSLDEQNMKPLARIVLNKFEEAMLVAEAASYGTENVSIYSSCF